jgi:hypothetical protein
MYSECFVHNRNANSDSKHDITETGNNVLCSFNFPLRTGIVMFEGIVSVNAFTEVTDDHLCQLQTILRHMTEKIHRNSNTIIFAVNCENSDD